jgi:uncharacterized membrane protein YuzA (DUF378 family)
MNDMKSCCGEGKGCCPVHKICWILVMVGSINWGLVGIGGLMSANWNLVNLLVGRWPTVESIVYVLVGVSAVMMLVKSSCKQCKMGMAKM